MGYCSFFFGDEKYVKLGNLGEAQFQSVLTRLLTNTFKSPMIPQMGTLFTTVRNLVAEEKYLVGQHAAERLEERGIMEWQAVAGIATGKLLVERPAAKPNPAIEVAKELPDGTKFKAVWSILPQSGVAKLVTVHFFD